MIAFAGDYVCSSSQADEKQECRF